MKFLHALWILAASFPFQTLALTIPDSPFDTTFASHPITRAGNRLLLNNKPWTASGANVYWLGLDENVIPPPGAPFYAPFNASYPTFGRITEAMLTLQSMGATAIRAHTLGVSVGNPLSLSPSAGLYNEQAFETMDWTVFQAREHGLRLLIPLVDNYDYYHGGKFTFLRWAGYNITGGSHVLPPAVALFYTDPTIIALFKNYIEKLLTHVNPYTGLSYAADPTIFAYETGNELSGPVFGDKAVPANWTQDICRFVKRLGPEKLCVDGTYGINSTHLNVPEIDMFSNHFYPVNETILRNDIKAVKDAQRVYLAGEIAWTTVNGSTTTPSAEQLRKFYEVIEEQHGEVAVGSMFWSLFGHDVPDCNRFVNHSDGYSLQYNNPLNSVYTNGQIRIIRQHFYKMQGLTVADELPALPCPAPNISTPLWSFPEQGWR